MPIPETTALSEHFKIDREDLDRRNEDLPATEITYQRLRRSLKRRGIETNPPRTISERDARFQIKLSMDIFNRL